MAIDELLPSDNCLVTCEHFSKCHVCHLRKVFMKLIILIIASCTCRVRMKPFFKAHCRSAK